MLAWSDLKGLWRFESLHCPNDAWHISRMACHYVRKKKKNSSTPVSCVHLQILVFAVFFFLPAILRVNVVNLNYSLRFFPPSHLHQRFTYRKKHKQKIWHKHKSREWLLSHELAMSALHYTLWVQQYTKFTHFPPFCLRTFWLKGQMSKTVNIHRINTAFTLFLQFDHLY